MTEKSQNIIKIPYNKKSQTLGTKKTSANINIEKNILTRDINNPLWISVSEAAKLSGVQTKTIRRAIKSNAVNYKIVGNRYLIDLKSLILYLFAKTKLKNKLNQLGIGQYIKEWKS